MDTIPDKTNESPIVASSYQKENVALDTKQIARAILELNITRKNVQVYPLGHDQVKQSVGRAHQTLLETLATHPELTLGIAKDALMIGDALLDPENEVFKEFALSLNVHGIASVTFEKGVEEDALLAFFDMITKRPSDMDAAGGIETALTTASLSKIRIRTVDYRQFYLTEETQSITPPAEEKLEDVDSIWQSFIPHLISGTLSQSGEDISVEEFDAFSAAQQAGNLNSGQFGNVTALDTYDRIISKHLRYTSSKENLAGGKGPGFNDLRGLLQELSPELRRQFLSVPFPHIDDRGHIPENETLLRGMSQKFVVDMLQQANEDGKEISPSLLSLVQKIAGIQGAQPEGPYLDNTESLYEPSREKLQQLFKREDHESFIVPEYDALLQEMARTSQQNPENTFPLEEHLGTMVSPHLDIQVVRVILAFLEMGIECDEYEDYAEQLLATVPPLLQAGAFSILMIIAEAFDRHQIEKTEPEIRSAAKAALKRIKTPELITKAIRFVSQMQGTADGDACAFLRAMGPGIVPETVTVLVDRLEGVEKDPLLSVLKEFRAETIDEVLKRLNDTRAHVLKNLLSILQAMNAREDAQSVQPFLSHPDPIVRMEALKTFLHFENSEATPFLQKAIKSFSDHISSRAIVWAGQYKIQAAVPELVAKIKRFAMFRADLNANERIFVALGQIGDPSAVVHLEKLEVKSFPLFRKDLIRMKRTFFRSLAGYPYESIIPLIKNGYRSKDREIRMVCQNIRRQFDTPAMARKERF